MPAGAQQVFVQSQVLNYAEATFWRTYMTTFDEDDATMDLFCPRIPSKRRQERYAYFESAPDMVRWPDGQAIPEKAFLGRTYTTSNYNFGRRVGINRRDALDEQTKSAETIMQDMARRAKNLRRRLLTQRLESATNLDLLPANDNGPDGSAEFITTTRFGVSTGNSLTGTGTTGEALRNDFWAAYSQFLLFQDTEGQPLLNTPRRFLVVYPPQIARGIAEAFLASPVVMTQTIGGTGTAAGVQSSIQAAGIQLLFWALQGLTDVNDWYTIALDTPVPPFAMQVRSELEPVFGNPQTSDLSAQYNVAWFQAQIQLGLVTNLPYMIVRTTN